MPPSLVSGTPFQTYTAWSNKNGTTNGGTSQPTTVDEDDLLAAFKADAPVDSSSHFPKPSEYSVTSNDPVTRGMSSVSITRDIGQGSSIQNLDAFDDDDPFGLAQLPKQLSGKSQILTSPIDEDDVLGLLGKPVSELPQSQSKVGSVPAPVEQNPTHAQDQAMAELVDMGFPAERAREGLESTESGIDVQLAVGWLLSKAHSESRQKAGPRRSSNEGPRHSRDPRVDRRSGSSPKDGQAVNSGLARSNDGRPERSISKRSPASQNQLERDHAQRASELGTAFLKTAGSLWKTSKKKVQQSVQDLNSDSDSSQPRWMREPGMSRSSEGSDHNNIERSAARSRRRSSMNKKHDLVTDEAMMLESDRARPPPRKPSRRQETNLDSSADSSRDHSPAMPSRSRQDQPAFVRQQQFKAHSILEHKAALNRQAIEDQASQAYVSSARRRKPASKLPVAASEPHLLESASKPEPSSISRPVTTQPVQSHRPSQHTLPVLVRPAAPSRNIPPICSISLKASHAFREAGNDHFKRGDYSAAHLSYTSSLKHVPTNHPITIVLHTIRALTALKIGEPKTAISDTQTAITVIGPSRGEAETIDLSNGEPPEPMRHYFGKALMRQAEALEQMEKWKEAAVVWKEAVEGGHGGATSVQGRLRCEKSVIPPKPRPAKSPSTKKSNTSGPTRSAISDLNGTTVDTSSAAAVKRLRAANAAADRADDEKFALANTVDSKLTAWKGTKADNLRALLGSLNTVLWPEAGWKKIGMAELVLPAKVKLQYMKGIAKVHPDKVRHLFCYSPYLAAGSFRTRLTPYSFPRQRRQSRE